MPASGNGLPQGPQPGAPYADPAVVDGKAVRRSEAALSRPPTSRRDAVFNKAGWHYPQQRMMALWGDVKAFNGGGSTTARAALLPRRQSNDVIEYWHTNLVPAYSSSTTSRCARRPTSSASTSIS